MSESRPSHRDDQMRSMIRAIDNLAAERNQTSRERANANEEENIQTRRQVWRDELVFEPEHPTSEQDLENEVKKLTEALELLTKKQQSRQTIKDEILYRHYIQETEKPEACNKPEAAPVSTAEDSEDNDAKASIISEGSDHSQHTKRHINQEALRLHVNGHLGTNMSQMNLFGAKVTRARPNVTPTDPTRNPPHNAQSVFAGSRQTLESAESRHTTEGEWVRPPAPAMPLDLILRKAPEPKIKRMDTRGIGAGIIPASAEVYVAPSSGMIVSTSCYALPDGHVKPRVVGKTPLVVSVPKEYAVRATVTASYKDSALAPKDRALEFNKRLMNIEKREGVQARYSSDGYKSSKVETFRNRSDQRLIGYGDHPQKESRLIGYGDYPQRESDSIPSNQITRISDSPQAGHDGNGRPFILPTPPMNRARDGRTDKYVENSLKRAERGANPHEMKMLIQPEQQKRQLELGQSPDDTREATKKTIPAVAPSVSNDAPKHASTITIAQPTITKSINAGAMTVGGLMSKNKMSTMAKRLVANHKDPQQHTEKAGTADKKRDLKLEGSNLKSTSHMVLERKKVHLRHIPRNVTLKDILMALANTGRIVFINFARTDTGGRDAVIKFGREDTAERFANRGILEIESSDGETVTVVTFYPDPERVLSSDIKPYETEASRIIWIGPCPSEVYMTAFLEASGGAGRFVGKDSDYLFETLKCLTKTSSVDILGIDFVEAGAGLKKAVMEFASITSCYHIFNLLKGMFAFKLVTIDFGPDPCIGPAELKALNVPMNELKPGGADNSDNKTWRDKERDREREGRNKAHEEKLNQKRRDELLAQMHRIMGITESTTRRPTIISPNIDSVENGFWKASAPAINSLGLNIYRNDNSSGGGSVLKPNASLNVSSSGGGSKKGFVPAVGGILGTNSTRNTGSPVDKSKKATHVAKQRPDHKENIRPQREQQS